MLESGYVRIYRSFPNWEWYDDANTMRVFLHLILTANWESKKWHGITIERGQRVYSRSKLAAELKISEKNVRTAINHLISTGEVANRSTREYSIITIKNYDSYQQVANEGPTGQNEPETPMSTGLDGDIFQNQHNKNNEKSANEPANDRPSENPHDYLENQQSHEANRPANRPTTGQRPANDRPQLKKDKESNNDKDNIRAGAFTAYAGEDTELLKALNDYAEMRKQKKKPLTTERAVKMLFNSLDKLAPDSKTKIAILNQSVFYNWTGVFPLKSENQTKQSKPEKQYTFDVDEYEKESLYDTEMKK